MRTGIIVIHNVYSCGGRDFYERSPPRVRTIRIIQKPYFSGVSATTFPPPPTAVVISYRFLSHFISPLLAYTPTHYVHHHHRFYTHIIGMPTLRALSQFSRLLRGKCLHNTRAAERPARLPRKSHHVFCVLAHTLLYKRHVNETTVPTRVCISSITSIAHTSGTHRIYITYAAVVSSVRFPFSAVTSSHEESAVPRVSWTFKQYYNMPSFLRRPRHDNNITCIHDIRIFVSFAWFCTHQSACPDYYEGFFFTFFHPRCCALRLLYP